MARICSLAHNIPKRLISQSKFEKGKKTSYDTNRAPAMLTTSHNHVTYIIDVTSSHISHLVSGDHAATLNHYTSINTVLS